MVFEDFLRTTTPAKMIVPFSETRAAAFLRRRQMWEQKWFSALNLGFLSSELEATAGRANQSSAKPEQM